MAEPIRIPVGHWTRVTLDGRLTARIVCPNCGTAGLLDHDISSTGQVTPSVVCAASGCSFHTYIVLDGWMEDT